MDLAVVPPVEPMLAQLARELPSDDGFVYEPKWDGFRCLVFRNNEEVDMRSRKQSPLARYFPELAGAFRALPSNFALDGEIVVTRAGQLDFVALLERLHPAASRVERLRHETPASFIAFDLLAIGREDLRARSFAERRGQLEKLLRGVHPPLFLTPATADREVAARWLERFQGGGLDGVVAKHESVRYQPGKRAMVKIKHERTADCVVGGFRWHDDEYEVGSLLLGLYDADEELHHAGLCTSFSAARRRELVAAVEPLIAPLQGHPWENGFNLAASPVGRLPGAVSRWQPGHELTWVPLRPELVVEVSYDHLQVDRFRHAAKFRRWRPDRAARSCTYDQLSEPAIGSLPELLGAGA